MKGKKPGEVVEGLNKQERKRLYDLVKGKSFISKKVLMESIEEKEGMLLTPDYQYLKKLKYILKRKGI